MSQVTPPQESTPGGLYSVGIPVYNEEKTLSSLLDQLLGERQIAAIYVVDDGSTDRSAAIAKRYAENNPQVFALRTNGNEGQLQGWITAARAAGAGTIVFIDADSRPENGATDRLAQAVNVRSGIVAAGGRVIAAGGSERVARSRFSDLLLHNVRLLGLPKETLIGRFFAVDTEWFLQTIERTDIIANDTYLSCHAARAGFSTVYAPAAACRYVAATTFRDAAAQRQRADAGYAQLRSLHILHANDEPTFVQYMQVFVRAALKDPQAAIAWLAGIVYSISRRVYAVRSHAGTWETQASTKRPIM